MDEKVIRLLFKNYGRKEKSGERHLNTPGEMDGSLQSAY